MNFVQPWFLAGLLLAAVPILIHLINRRRARPLPFSALEFLLRGDSRLARRLKLKEWLLLTLRTLLVCAIPIALARPFVPDAARTVTAIGDPHSVVVVVDRGLDTWAIDDATGEPLFDRIRAAAAARLRALPAGSTASVVLADSVAEPLVPHLSAEPEALARRLGEIRPSYTPTDLVAAVRAARVLLEEEGLERQKIVVFGRLEVAAVDRLQRMDLGAIGLDLEPVRRTAPARNVRVVEVTSERGRGGPGHLIARLHNAGEDDAPVSLSLDTAGQVVRRDLTLAAGEVREVPFGPEEGAAEPAALPEVATVTVAPQDGAPADDFAPDDTWTFLRGAEEQIRILVINGAPRPIPFQDEAFFLTRALDAIGRSGRRVRVDTMTPDAMRPATVSGRDIIFCVNVHLLAPDVLQALQSAVMAGAGVLVTLGDHSDEEFASRMRDILALPLREIHGSGTQLGDDQGLSVGAVETDLEAARELGGATSESLKRARVFRHGILAPASPADGEVQTWIKLESGAPLLVERRMGAGSLMLLATSVDLDWTDLPAHPGYLPLIGVLVEHLSGRGQVDAPRQILPSAPWSMRLPNHVDPVDAEATGPARERPPRLEVRATDDGLKVLVRGADQPGLYQVWLRDRSGRELARRFAVNVDRPERPAALAAESAVAAARRVAGGVAPRAAEALAADAAEVPGTPIWPLVLLALVLLLASETYAALRI